MTRHEQIITIETGGSGANSITRRALLGGTAIAIFGLAILDIAPNAAFAQTRTDPEVRAFHFFSIALTGHKDISPATSTRMFDLLKGDKEIGPRRIAALLALADSNHTPQAIKTAAIAAGLDAELTRVLTAWYTGTVETTDGPVVLAYQEALMYRPVADGMTVPTYCNKGPMWWTGLPPEITRVPVNNPKVL